MLHARSRLYLCLDNLPSLTNIALEFSKWRTMYLLLAVLIVSFGTGVALGMVSGIMDLACQVVAAMGCIGSVCERYRPLDSYMTTKPATDFKLVHGFERADTF